MAPIPENAWFEYDLVLRDRSNAPLTICAGNLTLMRYSNELIECRLTFQVSPEDYQSIDTKALFNLKQPIRGSLRGGEFLNEYDFQIEVMLKPHLLFSVKDQIGTIHDVANYILNLSQEQPEHPLLLTENWLCLSVKQPTAPGEPGSRTFWADMSPAAIIKAGTSSEEISAKIVNLFQEWAEADLAKSTQQTPLTMLEGMVDLLKELADFGDALAKPMPEASTQEADESEASLQPLWANERILEVMIRFFTEDDWSFTKIQGQSSLKIGFQGKNGEWMCYAKAKEEQQQFVFYSIAPINVPEEKRSVIAEFLTRANYGMTIGNFELDFADGEIRYKTSIDVEGVSLTFPQIKRLVYTNVTMMDEYLPGIMSVIDGDVLPVDAIAQIEG
jgi:hypothetical protein